MLECLEQKTSEFQHNSSSTQHPPLNCMLDEHHLRFGIESSYRLMPTSGVRTSMKDPKLRVLYVATILLLVNAWVMKKWDRLSTKRRGPGGRDVHADLLLYPRLLAMLQYVLERVCGFILAIMVPQK